MGKWEVFTKCHSNGLIKTELKLAKNENEFRESMI